MKVSKQQAALNRERVLATAATLFRERGFDGIGVADLMKAAGLTHGGFYANFASKEDLIAEASAKVLGDNINYWQGVADSNSGAPPGQFMADYLQGSLQAGAGSGCLLAALGAEAARHGDAVRQPVRAGVQQLITTLTPLMPAATPEAQRMQAIAAYAATVGALILARAVDEEAFSAEVVAAVAAAMPGE